MDQYAGYLIKRERLKRNLSQEGLCKGICVVSYLSKIEKGKVQANIEILNQLFERLGITYISEKNELREMEKLLEEYFDCFFHGEETEAIVQKIMKKKEKYQYSRLYLEYELCMDYKKLEKLEEREEEFHYSCQKYKSFLAIMNENQKYLTGCLCSCDRRSKLEEQVEYATLAERQKQTSWILLQKGSILFRVGKYIDAMNYFEKAYEQAAREGRVKIMFESSFMLAICYSNHDQTNMLKYYQQTAELARVIYPGSMANIYYNIGATYVECEEYAKAKDYLEKAIELFKKKNRKEKYRPDAVDWILVYHKMAICSFKLGNLKAARAYLEKARKKILPDTEPVVIEMLDLIEMWFHTDYISDPAYEYLLKDIYNKVGEKMGKGFERFHGKFLVELYKKKRRYKEALELTNELNEIYYRK